MSDKNKMIFVAAVVVAFIVGGIVRVEVFPPQRPERPVLQFLAKVAKTAMWFMLIAEPQQPPPKYSAVDSDHICHARSL